jgi:putative ABC transport system permease protein
MATTLFRYLSLRAVSADAWRALLSVCAVATGIALVIAVSGMDQATFAAFTNQLERATGRVSLQVVPQAGSIPASFAHVVEKIAGVAEVIPVVQETVPITDAPEQAVTLVGVDVTSKQAVGAYQLAGQPALKRPLAFINSTHAIIVARPLAEERTLAEQSTFTVAFPTGARTMTVRGIFDFKGAASVLGGRLLVMDILAAQQVLGRGDAYDRVDLVLAPGTDLGTAAHAVEAAAGPGFDVVPPQTRGRETERVLASYRSVIRAVCSLSLVLAAFLIFNTIRSTVTRRQREIGILRAVGATRRQVARLFLNEALGYAVLGTVAGIPLGLALGRVMAPLIGFSIEFLTYRPVAGGPAVVDPTVVVGCALLGPLIVLIGAWSPTRSAGMLPVIEVLSDVPVEPRGGSVAQKLGRAALLLAASGLALWLEVRWRSIELGYVSLILFAAATGGMLALPVLALGRRIFRALFSRTFGALGELAVGNVERHAAHASIAAGVLAISLSVIVAQVAMVESVRRSVRDFLAWSLDADLIIQGAAGANIVRGRSFDGQLAVAAAAVPGVAAVNGIRFAPLMLHGEEVTLVGYDANRLITRATDSSAVVSENFALNYGVRPGDSIELPAPAGTKRFLVSGTIPDYSSHRGSIWIKRDVLAQGWGDALLNRLTVTLAPGADASATARELETLTAPYQLTVLTTGTFRTNLLSALDSAFRFTYVAVGIIALASILAISETLTAAVRERRRELGTLRSVGALHRQLRRMVSLEAMLIAGIGAIVGVVTGIGLAAMWVSIHIAYLLGWVLQLHVPWQLLLVLPALAVGIAVLAAWVPARLATQLSIEQALSRS